MTKVKGKINTHDISKATLPIIDTKKEKYTVVNKKKHQIIEPNTYIKSRQ